jgi:outer membrane protein TolC
LISIFKYRLGLLAGAALLVSGCSVVPQAFTANQLIGTADDRLERVTADQEPVHAPISLDEAMARALKYNLDQKVEIMQQALRVKELDLSHYNMLPSFVTYSGYSARDNYTGGLSLSLATFQPSLQPSTSQERKLRTADVGFSWNILDFGLSYVRARQAADKAQIAEEMRRKVVHRIIEDVRTAYWRAVSADRLIARLSALEGRTTKAIANARSLYDSRQTSPITALTYERELVEITRTVQELQRELSIAKSQLAALMNVPPGQEIRLSLPTRDKDLPKLCVPAKDMLRTAMLNRPELREVSYQQRINEHEADAALIELLPGFNILAASNYDSNDLLQNNNWLNWGAKASWNLLRVFQYPARKKVIEAQGELLDARSLALTMAIMTQVHVSRTRFMHFGRELKTAAHYFDVQRRLLSQMRVEAGGDRISEQTMIREEMNTLVAEVKFDLAYANVQNAYANIFASMGIEPYSVEGFTHLSVNELSDILRHGWFARGDYSKRLTAHNAQTPLCESWGPDIIGAAPEPEPQVFTLFKRGPR